MSAKRERQEPVATIWQIFDEKNEIAALIRKSGHSPEGAFGKCGSAFGANSRLFSLWEYNCVCLKESRIYLEARKVADILTDGHETCSDPLTGIVLCHLLPWTSLSSGEFAGMT